MITAEVICFPNKINETALILQNVGFKILYLGETLTIGGDQNIYESTFKIKLLKKSKSTIPDLSNHTKTEFFEPEKHIIIPDVYKSLIKDLIFAEPPEFF
ncbi:MAG: hypothetical protein ACFFD7_14805 [Candidatus Thorarchaeota archaeon]